MCAATLERGSACAGRANRRLSRTWWGSLALLSSERVSVREREREKHKALTTAIVQRGERESSVLCAATAVRWGSERVRRWGSLGANAREPRDERSRPRAARESLARWYGPRERRRRGRFLLRAREKKSRSKRERERREMIAQRESGRRPAAAAEGCLYLHVDERFSWKPIFG